MRWLCWWLRLLKQIKYVNNLSNIGELYIWGLCLHWFSILQFERRLFFLRHATELCSISLRKKSVHKRDKVPQKLTPKTHNDTATPQTGQIAHFNSRRPTSCQDSSSLSTFASVEHNKMHSSVWQPAAELWLSNQPLKKQSFRCFQISQPTRMISELSQIENLLEEDCYDCKYVKRLHIFI